MGVRSNDHQMVGGKQYFEHEVQLAGNTGLTAGSGASGVQTYQSWVEIYGNVVKTSIFIDLTGALSAGGLLDIIGVGAASANCHIGQITTANNGTLFAGKLTCLETLATGETDVDLYSADEGTGAENAVVTDLTQTKLIESAGNLIGGGITTTISAAVALPTDGQYLYLVKGATNNTGTYTAGKVLIEFWGTQA